MSTVYAEQPGAVVRHLALADSALAAGTQVLVVETMKFETTICSPAAGVLDDIAPLGQVVEVGSPLFTIRRSP